MPRAKAHRRQSNTRIGGGNTPPGGNGSTILCSYETAAFALWVMRNEWNHLGQQIAQMEKYVTSGGTVGTGFASTGIRNLPVQAVGGGTLTQPTAIAPATGARRPMPPSQRRKIALALKRRHEQQQAAQGATAGGGGGRKRTAAATT